MSRFRLVVLLPLVTAAGCYNDAPSQSTLPQLQYVSGPPGGAIDPGYGYDHYAGNPAYEVATPPTADNAIGSVPATPEEPAPESEEGDEGLAEASPTPEAPTDPTARITDAEIDATLDGYGQWIETDDYGQVWRPDATVVGVDFTPYESGGSWLYTDAGWAFSCEYPWGWLPFHYGQWAWFQDYWGWVPDYQWGPAWVDWRHGRDVVGWRPIAPRIRDHRHAYHYGSRPLVRDHRHAEQHDAHWRFATVPDFGRPHIRSHLYGNLAEGLRVTKTVNAPPLRTKATVRAGDLMRDRFAAGGRPTQPGAGRYGSPQVRDHRSPDPGRAYQPPTQGARPMRTQPYPPSYNPPTRTYQPPTRTYQPPARTYQPPARTYQPPARTYQPPARSTPQVRTFTPPARTFTPPARTFTPPARPSTPPARSSPPSRSWSPPANSGSSHASGGGRSHPSSGGSSHSSSGDRGSRHR